MTSGIRTVGIIGLGNMGLPMATRLLAAGYSVRGFDLSPAQLDKLAGIGGVATTGIPDAAANSDVLILMLPDSKAVAAVMGDDAVLEALTAGSIVIDMGSSDPLKTRELGVALAEHGIRLVDAPVSGGVAGAVAGTLTIMVGGSDTDVAAVTPVLSELGKPVHAGDVGAGHAIKALNNLLSATHLWATSEAMSVGEKLGLDPKVMLAIFNGSSGRSGSTENKWPNFILTDSFNSGFGLRLMLKDMKIAAQLADNVGAPTVLGTHATELWAGAAEELDPQADHTEIARLISQRNRK